MVKEPHFTPKKMLSMLGLQSDSLGPYALIPGPKERNQMLLGMLKDAAKNFSFLDYEMHTGTIDGKRVTVGNGGRFPRDLHSFPALRSAARPLVSARLATG